MKFDEYIAQMEERRAREKRAAFNAEIARSLRQKTHTEALAELYACLTFVGGVSDVLYPVAKQKRKELVF